MASHNIIGSGAVVNTLPRIVGKEKSSAAHALNVTMRVPRLPQTGAVKVAPAPAPRTQGAIASALNRTTPRNLQVTHEAPEKIIARELLQVAREAIRGEGKGLEQLRQQITDLVAEAAAARAPEHPREMTIKVVERDRNNDMSTVKVTNG
jgi:hypothetical protein